MAHFSACDGINSNINGNILTYDESEDAYYIQHGADAAPKKLGNAGDYIKITGISFKHTFSEGGGDGGTTGSTYIALDLTPFSKIEIGSVSNYTVKIDGKNVSAGTEDISDKSSLTIQSSVNHYTYVNNSSASWSGSISFIKLYF